MSRITPFASKSLAFAIGSLLLWGCASQPEVSKEAIRTETEESSAAELEIPPLIPVKPARPFPVETLYSLLVAEIAIDRGRYDVVLGNYVQEAHRTRDPGVSAQATRIARFLGAHQAALNTSLLWVELEPENPEALFAASSELAEAGRLQEAFAFSETLLKLNSLPIFQSIAARAVQATDTQREGLAAEFDRLLADYPDDVQLLVGKSLLMQQDEELEDALALVRRALAIQGDDVTAAVQEAKLLYQLNRPSEALDRLLTLLQQNPDNQRLRLQYARLLAGIDLEEAQEQFEILVAQSPNDPDLLLSLGLVANERGDLDNARQVFERLLAAAQTPEAMAAGPGMNSRINAAHYHLGTIAEREESYDEALAHYNAVTEGQDFLPALARSVDIMVRRGNLEAAGTKMSALRLEHTEQRDRFYLMEAQALAQYQHLDAAEALLSEALTFSPTNADLLYSRAMINEQRDLLELTETDLRTIIKYQPNNAAALNALGFTLADRTDRYAEALELIEQALRIRPNDPAIIDSMGWVQYRLGNYEEAIIRLREALKTFPDPEIAAHLGEVLWVSGEPEQARNAWQEGLKLDPDSDIIHGTIQRLGAEK